MATQAEYLRTFVILHCMYQASIDQLSSKTYASMSANQKLCII